MDAADPLHAYEHDDRAAVLRWICTGLWCAGLLAAALGFLGEGPLCRKESRSDDERLHATWETLDRCASASQLALSVRLDDPAAEHFQLRLPDSVWKEWKTIVVRPEPISQISSGEGLILTFHAPRINRSERAIPVLIDYEPRRSGAIAGQLVLDDRSSLFFDSFVLP